MWLIDTWAIDELTEKLGVTNSDVIRKGAGFWVANGALRACLQDGTLVYMVSFGENVIPTGEGKSFFTQPVHPFTVSLQFSQRHLGVVADEEGEGIMEEGADEEETWTMCEEFIKAMLMNLERLSAERIQEMLTMTFDSYDKTLAELTQHLQTMVSADVIILDVDGNYALKGH